jgi:hypothetical protein
MLDMGPAEKTIIEQCYYFKRPLPDRIANAPELELGLELFLSGFLDLTSCRSIGFGEGPIPWLAIDRYCTVHDIVDDQREDFFYHIQKLDGVYLEWRSKEMEKKK